MIRILVFLTAVLAAGLAAVWIAEQSGSVSMVVNDTRYETSLPVAVIGVVALTALLGLVIAAIRWIVRGPEAFSIFMRNRRRTHGLKAVARGLVAVDVGDQRGASRAVHDARKYLPGEALTALLDAQAAQLSGDRAGAERAFRAMLDDPETRPLGLRGLFVEAGRRGDADAAMALAEEALRTTPDAPWAGPALLDYQCAAGAWGEALATVERNLVNRVITRAEARRQRAVLLTAQAQALPDERANDALHLAQEAVKLAPDLVPAAALAGRLLAESGDPRRASRVLESAWRVQPHPDLAEVYLRARPGDTAQDRLKRARTLAAKAEGHPEAALALARAALEARDFAAARTVLEPLIAAMPTVRACVLMAEIEETEHGDRASARGWLARAVSAPRDPAWVADGFVSSLWAPVSPVTGRLDAFEWKTPPEALGAPGGVVEAPVFEAMLRDDPKPLDADPLLVDVLPEAEGAELADAAADVTPPPPPEPAAPAPLDEALPTAPPAAAPPPAPASKATPAGDGAPVLPFRAPDDPGAEGDPMLDEGAPRPRTPVFGPP